MIEFINKIIKEIKKDEKKQSEFLYDKNGISTNWAFSRSNRNPGFFTPFNQKMGIQQSLIATTLMPVLKLQSALAATFLIPAALFGSIGLGVHAQFGVAFDSFKLLLTFPFVSLYFSGAFVLNLLKEITAIITRSIATLVQFCMGSNKSSTEPDQFADDNGGMSPGIDDELSDEDTEKQEQGIHMSILG